MTQIGLTTENAATFKGDAIVAGVFDDLNFRGLGNASSLAEAAKRLRFKGGAGESFFAFDRFGAPPKHFLVVGLGKRSEYGPQEARTAAALGGRMLRERFAATAIFDLRLDAAGKRAEQVVAAAAEGALLGASRFQKYVTDGERRFEGLSGVSLRVPKKTPPLSKALALGRVIAECTAYARALVNEPANVLNPEFMAQRARELARRHGFTLKVIDEHECAKLGMGAYLAVAKGSANPPRLIHLSYRPKGAKFHLAIVGKGLTFDSGGLSLKSADNMGAMKSDMSGSAAVMGTMAAVGLLKPKIAIDAVMAMCENMPGGGAYRPGDILTSMSGKTIEVQNTDAEGRLTLADALWYAQKRKPDAVIDLATLTGACVVALGPDFSGAMGNDQPFMEEVLSAAKNSGDNLWQLPMPAAYRKYIKSAVADVANISRIRWGGAITAGLFLQKFIDEGMPWVHLDIAGPALRDDDGVDAYGHEASGAGVRTLVHLILNKGTGAK